VATVLLVDDRAINREVARATLDVGGHRVVEATHATEALNLAGGDPPDIVVADVLMPGMDGYELLRLLRANPRTADIPVLLYSANYSPEETEPLARAYGATKVLVKTGDPDELLAAVEEALRAGPAERPAAPQPSAAAVPSAQHLRTVNAKLVEKVQALDASQARLETVAELSPVGIAIGDAAGRATYVNPRLCALTGLTAGELLGTGWLRLVDRDRLPAPGGADEVRQDMVIATAGRSRHLGVTVRYLRGDDGGRTGFIATVDDVTHLVRAEQRRYATQREEDRRERQQLADRLASLARMSGGVAHDFNNLLNVMMGFAEFAGELVTGCVGQPLDRDRADRVLADLAQIRRAGKRAAHLTHQLLVFGGREILRPVVVSPNALVQEVCGLLGSTVGQYVTIRTDLAPDLRNVRIDPSQLCQVLINLAVNARDALPRGGTLLFRTRDVAGMPAADTVQELPPGEYVEIAVVDDGEGMPEQVARNAIEPFFTTKARGKGTGLGLATAYGTMRQAGGDLAIESAPGAGTTVRLFLPATSEHVVAAPPAQPLRPAGSRTVLVAEDEDGVREVVGRVLGSAGYQVLTAANGEEALLLAHRHADRIDLVLTDVVMPRMDGPEFVRALQATHPEIPVLYMSGYAAPLLDDDGRIDPGLTVLGKPFTSGDLLHAIQSALAARPAR
jgi:PAS domain S-box-containing protein